MKKIVGILLGLILLLSVLAPVASVNAADPSPNILSGKRYGYNSVVDSPRTTNYEHILGGILLMEMIRHIKAMAVREHISTLLLGTI